MSDGKEGGINASNFDRYTTVCKQEFDKINAKLDNLDMAIRGNGSNVGIQVRLDRLEQSEKNKAKFMWMLVGISITSLSSVIVAYLIR